MHSSALSLFRVLHYALQWLKRYFDQQTLGDGITDYDAAARRALCKTGDVRGSGAASAPSLAEGGG
jgi:hypothetical protein